MQQIKYKVTYGGIGEKSVEVWAFSVEEAILNSKKITEDEANKGAIIKIEQIKTIKE